MAPLSTSLQPATFPASPTDMVQFLMRRVSKGEGTAVLELSGRIDQDRLREALATSLDVEPILACRFVEHWYRPFWQRLDPAQLGSTFQLVERAETAETAEFISTFLFDTIDPEVGPQIRVVVLRGPEHDTLLLKICHQCCDGPSFKNYLYWLIRLYNRSPDPPPAPEFDPASPYLSYDRSPGQIGKRITFAQKVRIIKRFLKNASSPLTWRFPRPQVPSPRRCIQTLTFGPELTEAVNAHGKERQAPLTVLLLAGLYRAARRIAEPVGERVKLGMTADLRRLFLYNQPKHPGTRAATPMSNLSGPTKFVLDATPVFTFDEAVAQIRDQFEEIRSQRMIGVEYPPLILSFPVLRAPARLLPFRAMKQRFSKRFATLSVSDRQHCSLANFGDFDHRRLALGEAEANDLTVIGPIYELLGMGAIASVFRNRLTLAIGFAETLVDQPTATRFLTAIANELLLRPETEDLPNGATLHAWSEPQPGDGRVAGA